MKKRLLPGASVVVLLLSLIAFFSTNTRKVPRDGIEWNTSLEVVRVVEGSPGEKAGVRVGDRVIRIDHHSVDNHFEAGEALRSMPAGHFPMYTVLRGEEQRSVRLEVEWRYPYSFPLAATILVVGLAFFGIGLFVYLKRPGERTSAIFLLLCLLFTMVFLTDPDLTSAPFEAFISTFEMAGIALLPALFVHFFLIFPERRKILFHSWKILLLVYVPGTILFLSMVALYFTTITSGGRYLDQSRMIGSIGLFYMAAFLLLGLGVLTHTYLKTTSTVAKKQTKWILWGTCLGVLPMSLIYLIPYALRGSPFQYSSYSALTLICIPLSFGYAIVRHRLLDIDFIIKKSVVYTILTALLVTVYLGVVNGIGSILQKSYGAGGPWLSLFSTVCIALLFAPVRDRVQTFVDKTFYKDKYDYRGTLAEFSRTVVKFIDIETLAQELVRKVGQTMHVEKSALLIRSPQSPTFRLGFSLNLSEVMEKNLEFEDETEIIRRLKRCEKAVVIEENEWFAYDSLPLPEKVRLEKIGAKVLVPLRIESELIGILSLGGKLSEDIYNREDLDLLSTIGNQAAVAITNAHNHKQALEKRALEEELDIAREIQQGLLPHQVPKIDGFDIAAINVPSQHVGGDYYDIIRIDDRHVGIAIGDVSGKGTPAALLMANLQATLRTLAGEGLRVKDLMARMNGLVHENTSSMQFITFFYGVLDCRRKSFTYTNAGHNVPLIINQDGPRKMLDKGGLVLGMMDRVSYDEETVRMEPGDVLVLYTDGVTEALNSREEEFGDDRVVDVVRTSAAPSMEALLQEIEESVKEFRGDVPQGDDITLLALKVLSEKE